MAVYTACIDHSPNEVKSANEIGGILAIPLFGVAVPSVIWVEPTVAYRVTVPIDGGDNGEEVIDTVTGIDVAVQFIVEGMADVIFVVVPLWIT
jgi:hypothetical protein